MVVIMNEIEQQLFYQMRDDIKAIRTAIVGDKTLGSKGMQHHIEHLDYEVADLKKRVNLVEDYQDSQKLAGKWGKFLLQVAWAAAVAVITWFIAIQYG